jgi:hypothetical protein
MRTPYFAIPATALPVVASSLIALMMEAASTSETLVNFYQTTRLNIPEDCHLQGIFVLRFSLKRTLPTLTRNKYQNCCFVYPDVQRFGKSTKL